MSFRLRIYFREFFTRDIKEKLGYPVVRLIGYVSFETPTGTPTVEKAIIDTGAHTTIIPFHIWKGLRVERIGTYEMQGLSPKPECRIPAVVGKVNFSLLDAEGNVTEPLNITAHLSMIDEVPLILGFKDLLSRFKVCFDYEAKEAYIEVKL